MFQFIKNIMYPAEKYEVLGLSTGKYLFNEKGESLKELFKRRDRMFMKHIQDSYPEMTEKEYLDIGLDTMDGKRYRLSAVVPSDKIGVVIEPREKMRHIILYRIVG